MFKKIFRQLTQKESEALENALAEKGLSFDSKASAEKHFFDERDKEIEKLNDFISKHSNLNLDNTPESLLRFEDHYFKCFVDKQIKTSFTKPEFELLMTLYVRITFVYNKKAKWTVVENDFSEGKFELGLEYNQYGLSSQHYARDLYNSNRKYLYDTYSAFAS